ncbi:NAD(P)-binding protein [Crucibulum laeve]|uniref:NAD(P)-binding protein n=1 Tax=Crucibulum laeve TaxID=68775 RepID=A0A5C3LSB7_9AGAR|nr:NAD(P)-binding protein [Crucibulum laeve]
MFASKSSRVWFITGASSGFGLSMTKLVLRKGDIVAATLRNPEMISELRAQYPPTELLVLQLDVTVQDAVENAFKKTAEAFGRIDIVYNNAGIGSGGVIEATPADFARTIFETNFWGASHVMKEAVKFFRDINIPRGGRLIQSSSMFGFSANAYVGYYAASKFALEGLTEALTDEVDPEWNIFITLVEPAYFRTKVAITNAGTIPPHPLYPPRKTTPGANILIGDTEKYTTAVYELSTLPAPPTRLVLGKEAIKRARNKIENVQREIDEYEDWSEDLLEEALGM